MENNNVRKISLQELLNITSDNILGAISVPVMYNKAIAEPISLAIENLKVGVQFADGLVARIKELEEQVALLQSKVEPGEEEAPSEDNVVELHEVSEEDVPEDAEVIDLGEFDSENPEFPLDPQKMP